MKRIAIPPEEDFPYIEDVRRIVRVLAERDIICSENDARELWNRYSDSMAAGWMGMDYQTDDEVYSCIGLDVLKFSV
jgi:hypothetical protein